MKDTTLPPAEYVLAMDIGTGCCSQADLRDGKPHVLKGANGTTIPSAVFRKQDGPPVVGHMAQRMAYKDPASFNSNFKTAMKGEGIAVLSADGSFTVVDAFAALFRHLFAIALQTAVYLKSFEQFGGSKYKAAELRIAVTIPAVDFGLVQIAKYRQALVMAGLSKEHADEVVFFKEPHAAAHAALAERGLRSSLMNGDIVLVVDTGDGTTDITVVEVRDGSLHTKVAHSGLSDIGGSNLTAALSDVIAKQLKMRYLAFLRGEGTRFDRKGIKPSDRQTQYGLFCSGEDAKLQLSVSDVAYVTVPTSKGNREAEISIDQAKEVWQPIFDEIHSAISNALGASGLGWSDVKYVVAAGGTSRTRGMRELIASATKRDVDDVLVCEEPQHAIVEGAVRMAQNVEEVDTTVVDGIGMTYSSSDGSSRINETYIANGEILPGGGIDVEKLTTKVRSSGKPQELTLQPFITKPGVTADSGDLLKDSEIVRLKPVKVDLNLPTGEHPVAVRIRNDVAQRSMAVLSFPTVDGVDSVATTLQVDDMDDAAETNEVARVIVLFDASESMIDGPLAAAQDAVCGFFASHIDRGVEVAVIRFGGGVSTVLDFTNESARANEAIKQISASGNTPMAAALRHAHSMCSQGTKTFVVLFSDGFANYGTEEEARKAAAELHETAELYTVPIGKNADANLMKDLASSPDHFVPVGRAADLKVAFDRINTLIYTGQDAGADAPAQTKEGIFSSLGLDLDSLLA